MGLKHLKELDGVRGMAALMVMFFHFFQSQNGQTWFMVWARKICLFGQTGVSLFFVLSGFLITRILIGQKDSPGYFKNFYIRRALRIFPLYYLFLILYYFVQPVWEGQSIPPFSHQVYYWFYLQNLAMTFHWNAIGPFHFWSLAVEEHFYLFWPFLIYFLNKDQVKWGILGIIVLATICRIGMTFYHYQVFYFSITQMDELALGGFLSILEQRGKLIEKFASRFGYLFLALLLPTILIWIGTSGKSLAFIQVLKINLISLVYFSFLAWVICTKESNRIKEFMKARILTYTGKISYGLYVFHPLCFHVIQTYMKLDSLILQFLASFLFAYSLSSLSFYTWESYFIRKKKYFSLDSEKIQKFIPKNQENALKASL